MGGGEAALAPMLVPWREWVIEGAKWGAGSGVFRAERGCVGGITFHVESSGMGERDDDMWESKRERDGDEEKDMARSKKKTM